MGNARRPPFLFVGNARRPPFLFVACQLLRADVRPVVLTWYRIMVQRFRDVRQLRLAHLRFLEALDR